MVNILVVQYSNSSFGVSVLVLSFEQTDRTWR